MHSDHLQLSWKFTKRNFHPRLERWLLIVSIYDFKIEYIARPQNNFADGLLHLLDESEPNLNSNEDYCDNLVATIYIEEEDKTQDENAEAETF